MAAKAEKAAGSSSPPDETALGNASYFRVNRCGSNEGSSAQKIVVFIRHAQSRYNAASSDFKREDPSLRDAELTALGQEQASRLADLLQELGILPSLRLVVASPLRRAIETADIGFSAIKGTVPFVLLPGVAESLHASCDVPLPPPDGGASAYQPIWDASAVQGHNTWLRRSQLSLPLKKHMKEPIWLAQARADDAWRWLEGRKERVIAVVSHGCFLKEAMLGLPRHPRNCEVMVARVKWSAQETWSVESVPPFDLSK